MVKGKIFVNLAMIKYTICIFIFHFLIKDYTPSFFSYNHVTVFITMPSSSLIFNPSLKYLKNAIYYMNAELFVVVTSLSYVVSLYEGYKFYLYIIIQNDWLSESISLCYIQFDCWSRMVVKLVGGGGGGVLS